MRVAIAYTEFVSGAVLISLPVCHRSVQNTDHFVSPASGRLALQQLAMLLFVGFAFLSCSLRGLFFLFSGSISVYKVVFRRHCVSACGPLDLDIDFMPCTDLIE